MAVVQTLPAVVTGSGEVGGAEPVLTKEARLDAVADRIRGRMARAAAEVAAIGQDLIVVKAMLSEGKFLNWIDAEFGMSKSTAYNMIAVAKRFGERLPILGSLSPTVLYRLAAPSTSDDVVDVVVEKAQAGDKVTVAMVNELRAERDDLKKRVAKAERTAPDVVGLKAQWQEQQSALQRKLDDYRRQADSERAKNAALFQQVQDANAAATRARGELQDAQLADQLQRQRIDEVEAELADVPAESEPRAGALVEGMSEPNQQIAAAVRTRLPEAVRLAEMLESKLTAGEFAELLAFASIPTGAAQVLAHVLLKKGLDAGGVLSDGLGIVEE